MPDDFSDLENELKSMRLRPVCPSLAEKIEQELTLDPVGSPSRAYKSATTWRSWKWAAWPVAAAAGVAIWFSFNRNHAGQPAGSAVAMTPPASVSSADVYKPVSADKLLASEEEERITLADGTPARRVRAQYVDTITWQNPQTKASFRWSVPREEVRVVPVSFQ